jgi:quercetin dioxygenase-like cupin family protein
LESFAMKPEAFVVTPDDYETALNVIGTQITVLAPNTKTQGYEITLQSGDEGMGPPPHCHEWDESFFILEGSVNLTAGDKAISAGAGTLVHVPAGTIHGFQYGPGGGKMLEMTSKGGTAVQAFTAADREIPPGPLDVEKVVEVFGRNGVRFKI